MNFLSQNKKIAGTAIALFTLSFSSMVFFLSDLEAGKVDVLHAGDHGSDSHHVEEQANPYEEILGDEHLPYVVVNAEGIVSIVGDDFDRLIGLRDKKIIGNSMFDFIKSEDLAELVAAHSNVIKEGKKIERVGPFRLNHKSRDVFVMLNAYPIFDKRDKVDELIFTFKDISEKLSTEDLKKISFK